MQNQNTIKEWRKVRTLQNQHQLDLERLAHVVHLKILLPECNASAAQRLQEHSDRNLKWQPHFLTTNKIKTFWWVMFILTKSYLLWQSLRLEKRRVTEQRSRSRLSALTEKIGCASNCNEKRTKLINRVTVVSQSCLFNHHHAISNSRNLAI